LTQNSIPDPFMGMNELKVEWIGEKSWSYKTSFSTPDKSPGSRAVLAFDGLDTFAKVKLNGKVILESDNMFISNRVDVTDQLSSTSASENILEIVFGSALLRGRELEKAHPEYKFIAHNGETGRLGVRKAQYHWVSSHGMAEKLSS
jgi:beta-mannosidase